MSTVRYNIALIGKTGVGKSTLVNKLVGMDVARVGVGRPVTEKGFHCYDCDCGGVPITVHDSWGLEANKADDWRRELKHELAKRGPKGPIADWFHTVIYCIGAGCARVEDFEIETIKSFAAERYRVLVVLTKADQATESELGKLQCAIDEGLGIGTNAIHVCAEEKDLPYGRTKVFGLDELRASVVDSFWTILADRLPVRCIQLAQERIEIWADLQKEWVDKNQRVFGARKRADELEKLGRAFAGELCGDEGPNSLKRIVQTQVDDATRQFFAFSGAYSEVDPELVLSLKVEFPRISHGLRIGLGSFFALLSTTLVLAPLFLIIEQMSKSDLKTGIDEFARGMKGEVAKLETDIRSELRKTCDRFRSESDAVKRDDFPRRM